jgi:hypothetical protein
VAYAFYDGLWSLLHDPDPIFNKKEDADANTAGFQSNQHTQQFSDGAQPFFHPTPHAMAG